MKPRGHTINGPVLRLCRDRILRCSASHAAALIDVTPQVWSAWELGSRRISTDNLIKLVDLFSLDSAEPLLTVTAIAAEAEAERQRLRRTKAAA